ncbi:MAG: ferrous iron transport protein B [Clostridiales bacterium]|jgi:ferrous iron transport protein B|nr:ferrous iron transport protein B [Clostridiales bacterium]
MTFALAGNQNSGKTTLFNHLTGSNQHVGNFPGVTVERKSGGIIGHKDDVLVDLPGIYSLSPYSSEEIVTRDFLIKGKPDGIINIVDATNIERNLYLTLQLIELRMPIVLALNMMDEVRANHGSIDTERLSERLGIPVVPISAAKKEGLSELVSQAKAAAERRALPTRIDFCSAGPVHRTIHAISHLIEDHALRINVPERFAATKLVEGDAPMMDALMLSENEKDMIEHAVKEMEDEAGTDREAALADMRYAFIEEACKACVTRVGESKEYRRSVRIDSLLTHKYLAIPAFLAVMLIVFWLTFDVVGGNLSGLLGAGVDAFIGAVDASLINFGLNPVMRSFLVEGVLSGVGAVLGFIPIIVSLFFFLSILEDSGYMARVAFVMDKPMRKIGLSGRSLAPLLIGFGCSVPAVMAARTLSGRRDRRLTVLLIPFMSCSAKLPVYALFTAAFFPRYQALVMISLYVGGILLGVLSAYIARKTVFKDAPLPFVMELPNYRFPSVKTVLRLMWDKAADFLRRALTVILTATVIIWFLQSFDARLNTVADGSGSMLASVGRRAAVIFRPLGFGDWRVSTSIITGFMAKEAVISTLAVLTGGAAAGLQSLFSPLSALSFLLFTLLYTPCVAAVGVIKRELGTLSAMITVLYQTGFAWAAAFIVYRVGMMFI